ncbi:hypothetical protein BLOT_000084 [Blomia tropicalis]|nr:hypothetical protein BLOT_000084 [Blomia tropicalis]
MAPMFSLRFALPGDGLCLADVVLRQTCGQIVGKPLIVAGSNIFETEKLCFLPFISIRPPLCVV